MLFLGLTFANLKFGLAQTSSMPSCESELDRLTDCKQVQMLGEEIQLSNQEKIRNPLAKDPVKQPDTLDQKIQEELGLLKLNFEKKWKIETERVKKTSKCKSLSLPTLDYIKDHPFLFTEVTNENFILLPKSKNQNLMINRQQLVNELFNCGFNFQMLSDFETQRAQLLAPKKKVYSKEILKQKLEEPFKFVQQSLMKRILKGRKESELTEIEKVYYQRIKKINDPGVYEIDEYLCQTENTLNGAYSTTRHRFMMCPGFLNQSVYAIISLMGHEIAHSFDPCNIQKPLVRFNKGSNLAPQLNVKEVAPNVWVKNDNLIESQKVLEQMSGHSKNKLSLLNSVLFEKIHDDNLENQLFQKDIYTPIDRGVEFQRDLQKNTIQCLVDYSSGAFYKWNEKDQQNAINEYKKFLESNGVKLKDKTIQQLRKKVANSPYCLDLTDKKMSDVSEMMADYWGSLVLGDYLEQHPLKSDKDKMALLAFYLRNSCDLRSIEFETLDNDQLATTLQKNYKYAQEDVHPLSRQRYLKLILANPKVSKAFGCENKERTASCYRKDFFGAQDVSSYLSPSDSTKSTTPGSSKSNSTQ